MIAWKRSNFGVLREVGPFLKSAHKSLVYMSTPIILLYRVSPNVCVQGCFACTVAFKKTVRVFEWGLSTVCSCTSRATKQLISDKCSTSFVFFLTCKCERIWEKGPLRTEATLLYLITHNSKAVIDTGVKPGIAILRSLHYTLCKIRTTQLLPVWAWQLRVLHAVENQPFYVGSSLAGRTFAACGRDGGAWKPGKRTSGHYRQVFVDIAGMLAAPIRLEII